MNNKKQLGQFFTKNVGYILQGFEEYIIGKSVIDPFAGGGDLLQWAEKYNSTSIKGYDIDSSLVDNKTIFYNDSLTSPLNYTFVLTNPPYLYQNKLADNTILKHSKHTDLFQLSLEKIMSSDEGIVIVPINFLSADNSRHIRSLFLDKFKIIKLNYFTNQVFEDTTYNVIAFYYKARTVPSSKDKIIFNIYPQDIQHDIEINKSYNWQIGGDFLDKVKKHKNTLKIRRLKREDLKVGTITMGLACNHLKTIKNFKINTPTVELLKHNIILLKAIDSGSRTGTIRLEDIRKYNIPALVGLKTSRNQAHLLFPPSISIKEQEKLIVLFNSMLAKKRKEYFSLFMTNFRDKNRKRISFNFAYNLLNYLYTINIKDNT